MDEKKKKEEGEGEEESSIEGLKRRHQEGIPCECGDPNCTMNLALDILRIAGNRWEEAFTPLSKIIEHYYELGQGFAAVVLEETEKVKVLGESIESVITLFEELKKNPKPAMLDDCTGE